MYGAGKADCAGHGVCESADSGVGFVGFPVTTTLESGPGGDKRTFSAKDSASVLVSGSLVEGGGAVVGFGAAKGFESPAGDEPWFEENGFAFDETLLVNDVAPNKLAPRSCFGF